MFVRLWLVFTALTTFFANINSFTPSNQTVLFEHASVEYHFDRDISFSIQVTAPISSGEMDLVIHTRSGTLVKSIPWSSGTNTYQLNLNGINIPAFSHLVYSYRINSGDGGTFKSPDFTFFYIDNRFSWKTLEQEHFKLHWYGENDQLRQNLIRISEEGVLSVKEHFPGNLLTPIDIYLYADPTPLRQSLNLSPASAVIAHAIPEEGVILVSNDPDSSTAILELERQVPHEMMHVLQYQTLGSAYANLPVWLSEGTASLAEIYPDPDAGNLVENAARTATLLPFTDLCLAFPAAAEQSRLAYAQSALFSGYLQGKFGISGTKKLISAYQNGFDCEHGFNSALGVSIEQAEEDWKRERLFIPSTTFFMNNILPYLLTTTLLVLSILFSFWFVRR